MKAFSVIAAIIIIILIVFIVFQRSELQETNHQLLLTKSDLSTTKSKLETSENNLTETKEKLTATELLLTVARQELNDVATELNTTNTKLQNTEFELAETESQLATTKYQLEISEEEQEAMQVQYANFREEINFRFGQGENCQKFITPDNDLVSAKATEMAGNYYDNAAEIWRDYERLYRWVLSNIEYSSDSYFPFIPETLGNELIWTQECWRMPEETLKDETGDCEDIALLLASLMLSYNNHNYDVWAIGISNEASGHLAVAFPVADDEFTILDPAGNYYTGFPGTRPLSYDITKTINDWLLYWRDKMPNAEIDSVFSDSYFCEFSNTEEFITWVKER